MSQRGFVNTQEAKDFFIQRVCQEASFEGTPLPGVEVQMLKWSKLYDAPDIPHDNWSDIFEQFGPERDFPEWEGKIQRLLVDAYERDLKNDPAAKETWKTAYDLLQKEDHLILDIAKTVLHGQLGSVFDRLRYKIFET